MKRRFAIGFALAACGGGPTADTEGCDSDENGAYMVDFPIKVVTGDDVVAVATDDHGFFEVAPFAATPHRTRDGLRARRSRRAVIR